MGRDGTVHVVFDTRACSTVETTVCTSERMFYTASKDGGATWSAPMQVTGFNLVWESDKKNCPNAQDKECVSPFGTIAVDGTGGPCADTLYAAFTDFAGDGSSTVENSDVWVSRSTDGGATWEQRVRVNDDGAGGKVQFHPSLAVDQDTGALVGAWHDARNDVNNKKVDFFAARSSNCGQSFEANVQVSQPSAEFNNSGTSSSDLNSGDNGEANVKQYGEYMGLDVHGGVASLAWTDSRHFYPSSTTETEKENVGFAQVRFDQTFFDGFETGGADRWSTVNQ